MKQELVTEKKWISNERFMRAYAVYQVLPGPEATELACYFGLLSRGRLGAIVGGVGFLLPGWMAMLLLSYIYVEYGLESDVIQHSFQAVQIAVSALIFRATYKLADGAFKNHKKEFSWRKGFLCFFCFVASVIKLNFFIALGVSGVINTLFESQKIPLRDLIGIGIAIATIGFFALYCALNGVPDGSLIGGDSGEEDGTTYTGLLELGLIAGMVTFGGAYTTLPFVYAIAVESGGWLTQQEFLDAIAITNMMPTPLVTFVTMVGYIGNGIGGAILITVGIFLPAFSFTIIGHEIFEALVDNKYVEPFLDGVGAAVIGLLLITAFDFLSHVVSTGIDAVVFFLAFWAAFHFTDKYTQPIILVVAGVAGQALY